MEFDIVKTDILEVYETVLCLLCSAVGGLTGLSQQLADMGDDDDWMAIKKKIEYGKPQ